MSGPEAKRMSTSDWQTTQTLYWKGKSINRQSAEFIALVKEAYNAMFEQNDKFCTALMYTTGKKLYHSQGSQDSRKTILTEHELCTILTALREQVQK